MSPRPRRRPLRPKNPPGPPPRWSGRLYIRLAPEHVGMARFLMEAYDNLALITVLERRAALARVIFSPQQEAEVRAALTDIATRIPLAVVEPPTTD